MHEKDPVISVIMGIYNCGDTLSEAIECIVHQTFSDWELIMCDDGSNDDTYEIAISYKEKYPEKIIVLQNEKNRGLNYTLNKCLKQARGKYIARMDADDISVDELSDSKSIANTDRGNPVSTIKIDKIAARDLIPNDFNFVFIMRCLSFLYF